MATNSSKEQKNILGTIGALQTILERYPNINDVDIVESDNAGKFIVSLLKQFGVTEEGIMEYFAKLLADKDMGGGGFINTLEETVKGIILTSFIDAYTCSVDPTLPDSVMLTPYYEHVPDENFKDGGIEIAIDEFDPFAVLKQCPTTKAGSVFYFDTDPNKIVAEDGTITGGYTPNTVYSSMDFNAYLWYCINRGMFDANFVERKKLIWDNRCSYYKKWEKKGCLNGNLEPGTDKVLFLDENCPYCQIKYIKDIDGIKKEFIICKFEESGNIDSQSISVPINTNKIRVFINRERYYRTGQLNTNKTILQFDSDFIYSLKLFDTKTLIAQILNSVIGFAYTAVESLSLESIVFQKKVQEVIRKIIAEDDSDTIDINDCFYSFDNDEYDEMMAEAMNNYNGYYYDNGTSREIDTDSIVNELNNLDKVGTINEQVTTITNVFKNVSESFDNPNEDEKDRDNAFWRLINKFIDETVLQIVMNILSPKIMFLFVINEKVMNSKEKLDENDVEGSLIKRFFIKFWNLIKKVAKEVKNLILNELYDFLLSQVRLLMANLVKVLNLESIMYYKLLLEDLYENCTTGFNFGGAKGMLQVEDVRGADIFAPEQTVPNENGGC